MNRLKELRVLNGLYQKDVAEYLNVDRTTYVKYETGDSEPNIETLLKLSKFFNVSVDYIINGENEPKEITIARKRCNELYNEQNPSISNIEHKLNINYATFKSWLKGYGDYFNYKIALLADYFDCSVDFLLGRTNIPNLKFVTEKFNELNTEGQQKVIEYISDLLTNPRYKINKTIEFKPQEHEYVNSSRAVAFGGKTEESKLTAAQEKEAQEILDRLRKRKK